MTRRPKKLPHRDGSGEALSMAPQIAEFVSVTCLLRHILTEADCFVFRIGQADKAKQGPCYPESGRAASMIQPQFPDRGITLLGDTKEEWLAHLWHIIHGQSALPWSSPEAAVPPAKISCGDDCFAVQPC